MINQVWLECLILVVLEIFEYVVLSLPVRAYVNAVGFEAALPRWPAEHENTENGVLKKTGNFFSALV